MLLVSVIVAVIDSFPLLCANDPLLTVKFAEVENVPFVLVNAHPEIVNAPLAVMLPEPPAKVPPLNTAPLEPMVTVYVPCTIVPVYPAAISSRITLTFTSSVSLPVPFPSKYAVSLPVGTENPPAPPLVDDQFAVEFQVEAEAATQ